MDGKLDYLDVEIEKCLYTINSIQNYTNIILYPNNNLNTVLDLSLLVTKYIKLLFKCLLKKSNTINKKIQKFEELFDILKDKYKTSPFFNLEDKKFYIRNLQICLHNKYFKSDNTKLIYMRFLNHFLISLNQRLYNIKLVKNTSNDIVSLSLIGKIIKFVTLSFYIYMLNNPEYSLFKGIEIPANIKVVREKNEAITNHSKITIVKEYLKNMVNVNCLKIVGDNYSNINEVVGRYTRKMFSLKNVYNFHTVITNYLDSIESRFNYLFQNTSRVKFDQEFYFNISDMNNKTLSLIDYNDKNTCKIRILSDYYNYTPLNDVFNYLNLKLRIRRFLPEYTVILIFHGDEFFKQTSERFQMINHILDKKSYCKKKVIISVDYSNRNRNKDLFTDYLKLYEKLIGNVEEILYLRIKKLVLIGELGGIPICLNVTKSVIQRTLKVPEEIYLFHINPKKVLDISTNTFSIKDDFELLMKNHILKSQLDFEKDELQSYEDKLNFFSTDTKLISTFPSTSIIRISSNNNIRDEIDTLAEFLIQNHVQVDLIEIQTMKEFL